MMLKLFKLWLAALLVALPVHAAEINDFDPTDANNIARWPEGMTFANVNNAARADEGILARFWKDVNGSLSTTGAANVYAVAANQTLGAYYTGLWIRAKANFTNTGAATMNFDALGAKSVKKLGTVDPAAGDIISGVIYDWVYDGTNIQVSGLNGVPDLSITTAKLADGAVTTLKIANLNVTWGKLDDAIFNQSPIAPALGDIVPFADISNSNVKAVATVQSILNLAGAGFKSTQQFTGSGTWTRPAGVTRILVIGTGGGGGGGDTSTTNHGGGGGGAGGTSIKFIDVSAIPSVVVTIGASGPGGTAAGDGTSGGNTTFGAHFTASGGGGGNGSATVPEEGGLGGTAATGDINTPGGDGGAGTATAGGLSGTGGASFWGGGGKGIAGSGNGTNARAYGAGGGGGFSTGSVNGGAGMAGIIWVLEFGQ